MGGKKRLRADLVVQVLDNAPARLRPSNCWCRADFVQHDQLRRVALFRMFRRLGIST